MDGLKFGFRFVVCLVLLLFFVHGMGIECALVRLHFLTIKMLVEKYRSLTEKTHNLSVTPN